MNMRILFHCLMLLVFGSMIRRTDGQTLNQSIDLMNEKLKGYDRRHRPIENQSLALQVNVSFDIVAIQTFDEVNSLFSVVGVVYMNWYDSRIVWNPDFYGGIGSQLYPPSDVWYPVLMLANPYDSLTDIATNSTNVRFYANGLAAFTLGSVFKTTCSADVTYYPFDTQTCDIRLVPWAYLPNEIELCSPRTDVLQNYFTGNGEWTIILTKAYHDSFNTIWFTFTMQRKPLFLVINVLLPVMFLAFLNTLVFLLPCESGERISYAITVMLSIAVFLTLVGDHLPQTSEPMSILSYYMMLILVLSTLTCLAVILNMDLSHRKNQNEVTWWGRTLVSVVRCKCIFGKKNKISGGESMKIPSDDQNSSAATTELVKSMFSKQIPHAQVSRDKADIMTWKEVSFAADKVCLLLFTGANIFLAAVFVGVLAGNQD